MKLIALAAVQMIGKDIEHAYTAFAINLNTHRTELVT
jgi:hypothetical protein